MLARNPGHEAELDDAVRLLSEALGQSADDDPARPIALTSMAGLLVHRWQRDGDVAALGRAVAGLPVGEITGATPCAVNVAELLIEYGEQTHDLALLQRGEALLREAAEMADPGEAATVRGSLANALITRFDLDGDEDRLTEAIRLAEAAVTATPPGPERAEHLSSLAAARSALARLNGDRQLLDTAIEDARAAAEEPATHASDRSGAVNALAMLLAERYDLLGDSADLEQSIALYDGFLDQPDVSADARPALLTNLANVLLSKFERDGDAADVHRAAALTDGAIQHRAGGDADRAAAPGVVACRRMAGRFPGATGRPHGGGGDRSGWVAGRPSRQHPAVPPIDRRGLEWLRSGPRRGQAGVGAGHRARARRGRPTGSNLHPPDPPRAPRPDGAFAGGGGRAVGRPRLWVAAATGLYTHVRLTARSVTRVQRLRLVTDLPA